jgi:NADPH:quinone reductase
MAKASKKNKKPVKTNAKAQVQDAQYAIVIAAPGGAGKFKKGKLDLPNPGKGQVLIHHTAIGLNFIDVYFRSGLYPAPGGFPAILGSEGAGIVEKTGAGVKHVKAGDRVAYTVGGGSYATHRLIAADRLVKIPAGLEDEIAAAIMLKGLTAQYLIHDCYPAKKGDTVLWHAAAGGVGLIACQWLAAKGVTVIGTAGGKAKCDLARKNGCAHVIDYQRKDFVKEVMRLTKDQGVAAVYDSVGKTTYPGSLQVLRPFGIFVSFGQSSGLIENFKLADLSANGSLFATRPTLFTFIATHDALERRCRSLFSAIKSGQVHIAVNQRFALMDVAKAHRALEGRETTGQTVLIP